MYLSAGGPREPLTFCNLNPDEKYAKCKNLYFRTSAGSDVCYRDPMSDDCPDFYPILCNITTGEVLPSVRYKDNIDTIPHSPICYNKGSNRLCIDRSDDDCSRICAVTEGCRSEMSHGSFCLSWEDPPRCHNLYWIGLGLPCFSGKNKCPTKSPILCPNTRTFIVSEKSASFNQQSPGEDNISDRRSLVGQNFCGQNGPLAVKLFGGEKSFELVLLLVDKLIPLGSLRYDLEGFNIKIWMNEQLMKFVEEIQPGSKVPEFTESVFTDGGFIFKSGNNAMKLSSTECKTPLFQKMKV